MKRKVVILGSTGSVGKNACLVAESLGERVEVCGLAAGSNAELLAEQCGLFGVRHAALSTPEACGRLKKLVGDGVKIYCGTAGMLEMLSETSPDTLFCSILGTSGLGVVLEQIRRGGRVAIASKEILVMAGSLVMNLAKKHNAELIPVDSEHSAIYQCLKSGRECEVRNLILTSSGGPFRLADRQAMESATFEKAIAHPVWSMGEKISVDSATLMNKALEMIEAHHLFHCPEEKIRVLVHPQAVIHSMVEFVDGVVMAQMGVPDMRLPIQYALTYPERVDGALPALDLAKGPMLEFFEPDTEKFPSLAFAREAIRCGGTFGAILNAANESAFLRFRRGEIRLTGIWKVIEKTLQGIPPEKADSPEQILNADSAAREYALKIAL